MAVTSPHVFYVGTAAYDLRKVLSWVADGTQVLVRFIGDGGSAVVVRFQSLAAFEAAMQASLDA